jgi:hypothetical protein
MLNETYTVWPPKQIALSVRAQKYRPLVVVVGTGNHFLRPAINNLASTQCMVILGVSIHLFYKRRRMRIGRYTSM